MPIEIRELVIRATVDPRGDSHAGRSRHSAWSKARGKSMTRPQAGGDDLVQRCVREVLRILDAKRER